MRWDNEPGDGSAGASPYRAHPTSDAYRRGGGSWEAQFRFCACIGTLNLYERTDPSPLQEWVGRSPSPRPSPLRKGRGRSVACARGSLVGSWKAQFRFPRMHWDHEPGDERTDPSPRPSPLRKGRGRRIGSARRNWPGSWRALFRFLRMHWDHEPGIEGGSVHGKVMVQSGCCGSQTCAPPAC